MAHLDELGVRALKFTSPFSIEELYNLVDRYFLEKGYNKHEKTSHEYHRKSSKEWHAEVQYYREITDYYLIRCVVNYDSHILNYVEIDRHGKKQKMVEGPITIKFKAEFVSDFENRFVSKEIKSPLWYYIKQLYDEYVYKHINTKYKKELLSDLDHSLKQVKNYFNFPGDKHG